MIIRDRRTQEILLEVPFDSLAGQDLRPFDPYFRYADISEQDISNSIWERMDLEGIQASSCLAHDINMTGCNLTEGILNRIIAPRGKFARSRLSMTSFPYGILDEGDFSEITIEGMVNFRRVSAKRAKFVNIKKINGANFFEADTTDAFFQGTDLLQLSEGDRLDMILTGTIFEYLMHGN